MIKVQNITKYYGERLALDDVSFSIGKGEIVGLLGPNAAGKTTAMRIITGFLMPTTGTVQIAGNDMQENSLEGRRHLGYMPESIPLYTDITVRAYLEYTAKLRGMDREKTRSRLIDVVDMCHLEEYVDVIIGKLSRGYRQRVGVAQAVIHEPEVLILDEPTIGIDPRQVAMTRQLIKDLGDDHTILLSSHILPEISMICDRVIIISEGKIVAEDRIENLSTLLKGSVRISVEVEGPVEKVSTQLRKVRGISGVSYADSRYIIECPPDTDLRGKITETIVKNGWALLTIETLEMSLEDIFLKLTSSEEEEEAD